MSQLNQQLIIDFHLEPEYSFANFIETPSTEIAYNASLAVARKIGEQYNPLFLFGGKGVGKTHLLKAIGNEIRSIIKNVKIIYIDSKNILAEQKNIKYEFDILSLLEMHQNVDLLIIDDIDLIIKKPSIDEKIFHLYNHLIQRGKQLVFAGCKPADQFDSTDINLTSRLKSGLTVKIESMNDEDKRKVIKKLSKDFQIYLSRNVADYILNYAPRDFKSIEKIISRINRLSLESKKKITISLAKKILQ